jgi:hypothetical protein
MTSFYRVYDQNVASEIPFRSMLPLSCAPESTIVFRQKADVTSPVEVLIQEWHQDDEALTLAVFRLTEGGGRKYRLHLPEGADFYADIETGTVEFVAAEGATDDTIEHLYLDQVLPRVLAQQGRLVLHGSLVQLQGGQVVGFVGDTGLGKSTLAAAFYRRGAQMLTDDSFILQLSSERVLVIPGYPSLRLWPDMSEALLGDLSDSQQTTMAHYSEKIRIVLDNTSQPPFDSPLFMQSLYVLSTDETDAIKISASQSPPEALLALMSTSFSLDITEREQLTGSLDMCEQIISSGLDIQHLAFPRRLDQLEQLVTIIEQRQ